LSMGIDHPGSLQSLDWIGLVDWHFFALLCSQNGLTCLHSCMMSYNDPETQLLLTPDSFDLASNL